MLLTERSRNETELGETPFNCDMSVDIQSSSNRRRFATSLFVAHVLEQHKYVNDYLHITNVRDFVHVLCV